MTASAPGFASTAFVATMAPSDCVIAGSNGIRAFFGELLADGNVALSVRASVLDPNTLKPAIRGESVRTGATVAVIQNGPVTFNASDAGAIVALTPPGLGR